MLRKMLLATALIGGAAFATAADAAVVSFSSNGSFSNIQNCNNGFPSCSISNGGNTLDMSGGNNSILQAIDFGPTAFNTDANDIIIGEITWQNNASGGFFTPTDQNFSVNYVLTLNFTQPNADVAGQTFTLNIVQPTNPPGDIVSGFAITGLPSSFQLAGVTVSDFRFTETGPGAFNNGVWTNPEGNLSRLQLTADFTAVPEPASLALFGAGLLGLAAVRRRQQRKAG